MGENSTCLVCLIRPNYYVSARYYPVQGYCEHSKTRFSIKPRFKINRKLCVLNIFLCLLFIVPLTSYIYIMPKICRSDSFMCLIFSVDVLILVVFNFMYVFLFFVIRIQKLELNCWIKIFYAPEVYKLEKILLSSEIKQIQFKKFVVFVLILFANICMGVLYFCFPYDVYSGHFLRRPFIFLCYSFQWYMVFEMVQRINNIKYVLEAFTKSIVFNNEKLSISRLQKYSKLVLVINSNFKLTMVIMSMLVFLWISQSTAVLIFNIFITIRLCDSNFGSLTSLGTMSVATILAIIVLLVVAEENVNRKVRFVKILFLH